MPLIPEYSKQSQIQVGSYVPEARAAQEGDVAGREISSASHGINSLAAGLQHMEQQESNAFYARTSAQLMVDDNKAYAAAQNGAGEGAKDFSKYYQADLAQRVDKAAEDAPSPRAAREFKQRLQPWIASRIDVAQHWEVGTARDASGRALDAGIQDMASGVYTSDAPGRELNYKNGLAQIGSAIDGAALTPEVRAAKQREAIAALNRGAALADIRDRPAAAEGWVLGQTGPGDRREAYYSLLRGAESGGQNIGSDRSSAFGPYQFTTGAWTDIVKAHPELNLTTGDRLSPFKQDLAIRALTDDNKAKLEDAGYPASFSNLYMMHFLGQQGGLKFLNGLTKGNADADARDYVSPAAANANPAVFNGKTAREVYSLFAGKFGDAEQSGSPRTPEYYQTLTANEREQFYQIAHNAAQTQNNQLAAALQQDTTNTLAKAGSLGINDPVPQSRFTTVLGVAQGAQAYSEYALNHQAAITDYKLQSMSFDEQTQAVDAMKPVAGDKNYAERFKLYSKVSEESTRIKTALIKDSAGYFTNSDNPQNKPVRDAYDAMRAGMTPETTAAYAHILDATQMRMGIPPQQRNLISQAYASEISGMIESRVKANVGNPGAGVQVLDNYKKAWGPLWPRIWPELQGKLSPVAMVIGTGIENHVAQTLLSVADKSAEQLEKDTVSVDDRKTLANNVIDAFKPLNESMGSDTGGGVPISNTIAEQARKLAAVYIAKGERVGDATEHAYKDLVGDRYVFQNSRSYNIRVPKAAYFDGLEDQLAHERWNLGPQHNLAKPIEAMGTQTVPNPFTSPAGEPGAAPLSTPATARLLPLERHYEARNLDYFKRNGRWMTAPSDDGVVFMVGGRPALRRDNSPLFMKWETLRANYNQRISPAQQILQQDRAGYGGTQ